MKTRKYKKQKNLFPIGEFVYYIKIDNYEIQKGQIINRTNLDSYSIDEPPASYASSFMYLFKNGEWILDRYVFKLLKNAQNFALTHLKEKYQESKRNIRNPHKVVIKNVFKNMKLRIKDDRDYLDALQMPKNDIHYVKIKNQ